MPPSGSVHAALGHLWGGVGPPGPPSSPWARHTVLPRRCSGVQARALGLDLTEANKLATPAQPDAGIAESPRAAVGRELPAAGENT